MDSDKFDRVVLDLLYGELDELTTAAAKRHMDQSARARDIFAHFRATRQLSVLSAHTPPPNFEALVLAGEARLLAELPLRHRVGRFVSRLAGYAMRPQLIMGALLLLMLGTSLMFLRARPGLHSAMQVTERGAPEADVDVLLPLGASKREALPPTSARSAPPDGAEESPPDDDRLGSALDGARALTTADAGSDGMDPFDQALLVFRAGGYAEAQRSFERLSRSSGKRAAEAALFSAQATRNLSGCAAAVSRFERVQIRFAGSAAAHEAAWRAASCLEQLGNFSAARQSYESLRRIAGYSQRVERALGALGERGQSSEALAKP